MNERALSFYKSLKDLGGYWNLPTPSGELLERMQDLGFWCQERTPFTPEEGLYWCGFTPHGTTGFNGVPDFWTSAPNRGQARYESAMDCLESIFEIEDESNETERCPECGEDKPIADGYRTCADCMDSRQEWLCRCHHPS